jgi:cyclic pyranopterin phosphate synthase
MTKTLTHISENNQPTMVNVSSKTPSLRTATARSYITIGDDLSAHLKDGELSSPKGPVFQTAIIAGTMGAKRTGDLIPFCHPIGIESCDISIEFISKTKIEIICTCSLFDKTGIEMEALTGASVAALTIYDMCKAFGSEMSIGDTRLIKKTGGKKDYEFQES